MRKNWIGSKNILVAESYIWWQGIKLRYMMVQRKPWITLISLGTCTPSPQWLQKLCRERKDPMEPLLSIQPTDTSANQQLPVLYTSYHSYTHCRMIIIMLHSANNDKQQAVNIHHQYQRSTAADATAAEASSCCNITPHDVYKGHRWYSLCLIFWPKFRAWRQAGNWKV